MHRDVIRSHGGLYLYHVTFTEYTALVHANHDAFLAYGQLWNDYGVKEFVYTSALKRDLCRQLTTVG
jgi:hypothetical protein